MNQHTEQKEKPENTLPEFEAKVYGTEDLKSFFALAHILVENLTIHIVKEDSGQGIMFRTMDPSHVAMLDVLWDQSNFEKWTVTKEGSFGINTDEVYNLVKLFDKKDTVTFSIQDGMLVFETKTSKEKLRLTEATQKSIFDVSLPRITYNARMGLIYKSIKDIVKRVALVDHIININMHGQLVEFSGKGDKGESNLRLEKGMPDIPEFEIKEDSECSYSLEYIQEFLKSVNNSVMIEFSTKMPMRMTTTFRNNSRVHFYLAPYVRSS